ncbi:MAG TPA: hypothetical protein VFM68_00495 [Candidatus Saccharimonadales bacterium]|nr:hypothetical protein [Candidatus Saccharimonadales bacterium]
MNQISDALRKSIAKKQQALEAKVAIAMVHLPRIIDEKHGGKLRATSRDQMRDILIKDGVLGARHNAKHIAHAKKHDIPLNRWEQQTAEKIINQAIAYADAAGVIVDQPGEWTVEIQLGPNYTSVTTTEIEVEAEFVSSLANEFVHTEDTYHPFDRLTAHLCAKLGDDMTAYK